MYRYIQKALDWGVKLASLAVTGPATWVVATELFADIDSPVLLFLMRFAAVFLIEGVLLSNWLLLEFDKNATPEIKARYGITALAMYISLLVIGWQHEGPTGLVFRVALLAALIGSGWDTYVYTWQKATARVDRSVENSGRVRRHARRLAIKEAMERRTAEHQVQMQRIGVLKQADMESTTRYGGRLIRQVEVLDEQERDTLERNRERWLLDADNRKNGNGHHVDEPPRLLSHLPDEKGLVSAAGNGNGSEAKKSLPPPLKAETGRISPSTNPSSEPAKSLDLNQLRGSIIAALEADASLSRAKLARQLGVDVKVVHGIFALLIDEEVIIPQGRNHIVAEPYRTQH